jgi:hypothetical protein
MIIVAFSNISGMDFSGKGIGKFLFDYMLKTFSPQKVNILGACLHLADGL